MTLTVKSINIKNMKRTLITIVTIVLAAGAVVAQPKAVGARLGYNFEASYQHETMSGMIEVDAGVTPFIYQKAIMYDENSTPVELSYHYGRAQAVVFYDYMMNLASDCYWYIGGGIGVSWGYGDFFELPRYNKHGELVTYRRLGLPVGAQIGFEYDFSIPLNLSLDWRPMINLFGLRQGDFTSNLLNVAIGVRYRF